MKKIITLILSAVMLATCAVSFASCGKKEASQETTTDTKKDFVIGITYYEPMNYLKDDGELTGFETEFARAVCEKLNLNPVFKEIDWNSKEVELNSKTIDCIWNGLTITDERKETMTISNPYMENKQVIVVKSENVDKYSDAANFKDANVVAEAGSAGEDAVKDNSVFAEAVYTPVDLQSKTLMEVKSGTADIAVLDYVASIGMIGDGTDYSDLSVVDAFEFSPEQYGIAFRKDDTETCDKFNDAIKALMEDGTVEKIATEYKLESLLVK